MLPTELTNLMMIPASKLAKSDEVIPDRSGVYLFFVRDGAALLRAANYFEAGEPPPLSRGTTVHVYTGAAFNLRRRMVQHLRRDWRGSSFRKTLLSVEHARTAVSRGLGHRIENDETLSPWLFKHLVIAIEVGSSPFVRERQLIELYGSPFNISYRRKLSYPRQLMSWREAAFPRWHPTAVNSEKRSRRV